MDNIRGNPVDTQHIKTVLMNMFRRNKWSVSTLARRFTLSSADMRQLLDELVEERKIRPTVDNRNRALYEMVGTEPVLVGGLFGKIRAPEIDAKPRVVEMRHVQGGAQCSSGRAANGVSGMYGHLGFSD